MILIFSILASTVMFNYDVGCKRETVRGSIAVVEEIKTVYGVSGMELTLSGTLSAIIQSVNKVEVEILTTLAIQMSIGA